VTARHLGLPVLWPVLLGWWTATTAPTIDLPPLLHVFQKKNPELPVLPTYAQPPAPFFWQNFPSNTTPGPVHTAVDTTKFWNYCQLSELLLASMDPSTKAPCAKNLCESHFRRPLRIYLPPPAFYSAKFSICLKVRGVYHRHYCYLDQTRFCAGAL